MKKYVVNIRSQLEHAGYNQLGVLDELVQLNINDPQYAAKFSQLVTQMEKELRGEMSKVNTIKEKQGLFESMIQSAK